MLVKVPLIVVGTVVVKVVLPEVMVLVDKAGTSTIIMLVGTPLIVVATVVVRVKLPIVIVVV